MMGGSRCGGISSLLPTVTVCYGGVPERGAVLYSEFMSDEHILVVDDDAGLRELLQRYLAEQGYRVDAVGDGVAMEQFLARQNTDLFILDLMLPGEDGLALARKLKKRGGQPIIMLSARGEDVDRIVGLEVGADDYLAKPFNPRELLARVRAVLRRRCGKRGMQEDVVRDIFRFGPFSLDVDSRSLSRAGAEVSLTAGEFNLLRIFAEHPHRVLSRDVLMDMLKGYERMPFDRSIDVRVTRLRRKIEDDPAAPAYIRTVWGEGYLFSPESRAA